MATLDTTRTLSGHSTEGRATRLFVGAVAALKSWNDARLTRKALSRLSDRELNDIGLTRADIDDIDALFR